MTKDDINKQAEIPIKRIQALTATAKVNAFNASGDYATAGADLMFAFVLIAMEAGGDPRRAIDAIADHAIAACEVWFTDKGTLQ